MSLLNAAGSSTFLGYAQTAGVTTLPSHAPGKVTFTLTGLSSCAAAILLAVAPVTATATPTATLATKPSTNLDAKKPRAVDAMVPPVDNTIAPAALTRPAGRTLSNSPLVAAKLALRALAAAPGTFIESAKYLSHGSSCITTSIIGARSSDTTLGACSGKLSRRYDNAWLYNPCLRFAVRLRPYALCCSQ